MRKSLLILFLLNAQKQFCMDVFCDAPCVLEPNKMERGKFIAKRLPSMPFVPILLKLAMYFEWYFGTVDEKEIQKKIFDFLRKIPLKKDYPEITYQGELLPPIIVAWLLRDLSPEEIQQIVKEYLETIPLEKMTEGNRNLHNAITYGTFDAEVMKKTAQLNEDTKKFLRDHKDVIIAHLIGNLTDRLSPQKKDDAEVFEQFGDRICISGEEKVLSPYPEFFDIVDKKFPGKPEDRIYLVAEPSEERKGSYFDAARKFSHHIHRPTSPDLERLLEEK
ncbi:MAG: hypothetical protein US13_C0003G0046 [candidate division TM6 bacterium GW2011_GWE2_36_25]|nr:MAG: hypothetical protein US03_C0003G0046 [candidate division TM6 bacterium GW2011_GWF2_36_131]KKQ03365.1 MAG: hypothetical protein US13_C0003G0046 [candidate division TM6 bacterium GW2011_GWE2_36_25]